MLLTIDKMDQKSLETVFLIAICRQSGDKWKSKSLFLMIFDLHSPIVLTFLIAYLLCVGWSTGRFCFRKFSTLSNHQLLILTPY